jgi:hypothetical protein
MDHDGCGDSVLRKFSEVGTMSSHIDFWNKVNNKQAAKSQHYKSLFQSLQAIRPGSVLLLRTPSDEPWLGQLIKRGQLFSRDKLKSFRGSHKRCHQNASCIWIMEQGLIGTGFAYTEYSSVLPGAWYQHSCGLDYSTKTQRVIETTHKFKDYYGVELDNEECKCFLLQNVLPMVKTVIEQINATETVDTQIAAIG